MRQIVWDEWDEPVRVIEHRTVTLTDRQLLKLREKLIIVFDAGLDKYYPITPEPVGEYLAELAEDTVADFLKGLNNG